MPKNRTTVQLSRAVEHDGRMVDAVSFAGPPGGEVFPVNETDGQFGIDALEVLSVIIRRTGLSKPALERLAPIDLLTVTLSLFLPRVPAEQRKAKK